MAATKKVATPKVRQVVRKSRAGRAVSDDTIAARAALDTLWANGPDEVIEVTDEKGNPIDSYPAFVVTPGTLGKPAGYTGMVGLIRAWAKSNGHNVRISEVGDKEYAVRDLEN